MSVSAYRPSRFMRILLRLAEKIHIGGIVFHLPDGSSQQFKGPQPGPMGEIRIHHDRVARRLLLGGSLGFCESYLDADWSSPNMANLFEMALLNEEAMQRFLDGNALYRSWSYLSHLFRPNSKKGAQRNIMAHYDLGNEFYSTWLDSSMTYSSALFTEDKADLEYAQAQKYQALIDKLRLTPGQHVLEIGCGWGGFAEYAAKHAGLTVTGITISPAQLEFARQRMQRQGLNDKVELRLQDYRDTSGQFDGVVSIEMFEAVGEQYWPTYFQVVRDRLADNARAALQIITIDEKHYPLYRRGADYIQKYIFPGGMLPTMQHLQRHTHAVGLKLVHSHHFRHDYARTLRLWNERFQANWPKITQMGFDPRFKRMWEQYLEYCAAGFRVGTIDVVQVELARG